MAYPPSSRMALGFRSRALTPAGWLAMLDPRAGLDGDERVEMTAGRWTDLRYVADRAAREIAARSDLEVHGAREHWGYPVWVRTILGRGFVLAGDCEDVALWMRRELVKLDWPRAALRLCYGIAPGGPHVVLIARTSAGDYALQRGRVVPWANERLEYRSLESWPLWRMILT